MNFDIDPVTANWPLPEPLFKSEAARLSWWDRFKARCAEILEAIEEPFTGCGLDE